MIECTCAREKILTICDSKKINILKKRYLQILEPFSWMFLFLLSTIPEIFTCVIILSRRRQLFIVMWSP